MPNTLSQIHCPNLRCRAVNSDRDPFCHNCGTYLPKRYLWVVGSKADTFQIGDTLEDRFVFCGPQVVFDTQPGLPLKMNIELPETLVPYLKLFPYRLHLPQIYTLLSIGETEPSLILLLEQAPLSAADLEPSDSGVVQVGSGIPLFEAWSKAQPLRQIHWLWQMAQLWQPLRIQGVASSLLQPDLLRVEGPLFRLLELENDFRLEPTLADLGQAWQQLIPKTSGKVADSLDNLCEELASGTMSSVDALLLQLETWISNLHKAYRVKIDIATRTDTGMVREHNEDACYPADGMVTQNSLERMAIVCDGVGGHAGGEVASGIAIEALREHLTQLPIDTLTPAEVIAELENASFKANDLICQRNDQEQRQDRQRMGTTLVAALSQTHQIYVSHIGDSRAYLITTQGCYQVMVDDDIASREVRLGYVPYREALLQPASGSLVQALGMASSSVLRPTVQRFLLDEDCLLLLCSDGLSDYDRIDMIWREELLPLLQGGTDLTSASKRLIELANELNGHDNVTVGLVHCHVTRQRQGAGITDTSLADASSTAAISPPTPTVNPVQPVSATSQPRTQPKPTKKWGELWLLLGLLLVGLGGVVAYQFGFLKLPLSQSSESSPSSPPPSEAIQQTVPAPELTLDTAQKKDLLVLKSPSRKPIDLKVLKTTKDVLFRLSAQGDLQEFYQDGGDSPSPNLRPLKPSTITLSSDSFIVIDDFLPVAQNPDQADRSVILIQTCQNVAAHPVPTKDSDRDIKANPLAELSEGKGAKLKSNRSAKAQPSQDALKPEMGWVSRAQLEGLIDNIIPQPTWSQDSDLREACAKMAISGSTNANEKIDTRKSP